MSAVPDHSPALSVTSAADAANAARIRHRLRDWLTDQRLPRELIADILLAVNEAVSNVVDHAYRDHPQPGPVDLSMRRAGAHLVATVADRGTWRPPPVDPGFRGRGLQLLRALAQQVCIDTHSGGTEVTATFTLPPSVT